MITHQTKIFGKQKKKLSASQIEFLDKAVKKILATPDIGELKRGDLRGIRVYKFKIANQEYLLAYILFGEDLTLLSIGQHQNFYRDLKRVL